MMDGSLQRPPGHRRVWSGLSLVIVVGSHSCAPVHAPAMPPRSLQERIEAACDGVHPGRFVLTAEVLDRGLRIPSSCSVEGATTSTALRGSAAVRGALLLVANAHDVSLLGFTCDGGRHPINCIEIRNSRDVMVKGVTAVNAGGVGVAVLDQATRIVIKGSVLSGNGSELPSADGGGIGVAPGANAAVDIAIRANRVFGNNQGITIFNSSEPSNSVDGVVISENEVFSNANDGIGVTAASRGGGAIRGPVIRSNRVSCNGWTGSEPRRAGCVVGALQRGAASSPAGVGIDIIGHIEAPLVADNWVADNVFDGISTDGRRVTAAVRSSRMNARIERNLAERNGSGLVGAGIWNDSADGNIYTDNVATHNNLEGFGCNHASYLTYVRNTATANQQGRIRDSAFLAQSCHHLRYSGNQAPLDSSQRRGVFVDERSSDVTED